MMGTVVKWIPFDQAWPPPNMVVFVMDATGDGKYVNIFRAVWKGNMDGGQPVMILANDPRSQTPGKAWAWTTPKCLEQYIEGLR